MSNQHEPRASSALLWLALGTAALLPTGAQAQGNVVCNGCVDTTDIKNGAVNPAKLRGNAVTTPKIKNRAVTTDKIADGAVGTAKLAGNAVKSAQIAPSAVKAGDIAKGAVTKAKIANGAVDETKLAAKLRGGGTQTVNVDCATGGSVQDALDNAAPGGRLRVVIDGVCSENIEIFRDLVTLEAAAGGGVLKAVTPETGLYGDGIFAVIRVAGAQNVVIDGITINGAGPGDDPNFGVLVDEGGAVTFRNGAIIKNASTDGLLVIDASTVDFFGSTIRDSGDANVNIMQNSNIDLDDATLRDSGGTGVHATLGASVRMIDSSVTGNSAYGIFMTNGAVLRLNGGNTVESSAAKESLGAAIGAFRNVSVEIFNGGNTITNTIAVAANANLENGGGTAIDLFHLGVVRQFGADTINGNVVVGGLSSHQLRGGATLTGNVYGSSGSSIFQLRGNVDLAANPPVNLPMTINGNVYPDDSSFISLGADLTINGDVDCTNGEGVTQDFANFQGAGDEYLGNCSFVP